MIGTPPADARPIDVKFDSTTTLRAVPTYKKQTKTTKIAIHRIRGGGTTTKPKNQPRENNTKIRRKQNTWVDQTNKYEVQGEGLPVVLSSEMKTIDMNHIENCPSDSTRNNENQLHNKNQKRQHEPDQLYENQTLKHADQGGGCHELLSRESKNTVINNRINGPVERTKSSKNEKTTLQTIENLL